MRIAILVQNGVNIQAQEAPAVQLLRIVRGLRQAGHHVDLFLLQGRNVICESSSEVKRVVSTAFTSHPVFLFMESGARRLQTELCLPYFALFDSVRFFEACLSALRNYDVVYERNGLYTWSGAYACQRLGKPYVLMSDADVVFELDFMGKPLRGLSRVHALRAAQFCYRTAAKIICVSDVAKEMLVNLRNVPREKIAVLPNAADVHISVSKERIRNIRSHLGLEDNPTVVFVGNFYRWHDTAIIVEAFKEVVHNVPDARLVFIGDGEMRPATETRVSQLGIADYVRFTGRVKHRQIADYISACDVAVAAFPPMEIPFWGSPMKIFEYMAAGKAIVASRVSQISEIIRDGYNGVLVEPGQVKDLAKAIVMLLCDPVKREWLGQNARREAVERYSWEHYIRQLEQIYLEVINKGRV
jgi:glycosyltransferase involved in cell wall biosynthesis